MKEFLEIMGKDITSENFTSREYVVFGIVAPLVLVLVCGLAGSLVSGIDVAIESQYNGRRE